MPIISKSKGAPAAPVAKTSIAATPAGNPTSKTTLTDPSDNPSGALILYNNLLVTASNSSFDDCLTDGTWNGFASSIRNGNALFQLGSATTIDTICIGAHNLGEDLATVVTVEVAATIGGALTEVAEVTPTTNDALMFTFTAQSVAEIKITWLGTSIPTKISVVSAGVALQMPRNIYGGHTPLAMSEEIEFQSVESESGQFLGRTVIRKGYKGSFKWQFLDDDWYRSDFNPFVKSAISKPFFIAWRPDLYSSEVFYGWTTAVIKPSNMGGGHKLMSVTLPIKGHLDI